MRITSTARCRVVRDFSPAEVWEGVPVPPHEPLAALRTAALARGAAWRTFSAATGSRSAMSR